MQSSRRSKEMINCLIFASRIVLKVQNLDQKLGRPNVENLNVLNKFQVFRINLNEPFSKDWTAGINSLNWVIKSWTARLSRLDYVGGLRQRTVPESNLGGWSNLKLLKFELQIQNALNSKPANEPEYSCEIESPPNGNREPLWHFDWSIWISKYVPAALFEDFFEFLSLTFAH